MSAHSEDVCEYELLRRKNIEENIRVMKELGLYKENYSTDKSEPLKEKHEVKRRTQSRSAGKRCKDKIESRRSTRLTSGNMVGNIVKFTEEVSRQILGDTDCCYITWGDENDDFATEHDFKSPKKRKKMSLKPRESIDNKLSVEDITEEHLNNIVQSSGDKVYSQDGTTCHQCRQKTIDQKTICRSSECIGVRGQFCGPCLKNRYGESVAESLKDPDWICPPCRNMCNCSICRTNAGKIPTGQLAYVAQVRGYNSVKHLLDVEGES